MGLILDSIISKDKTSNAFENKKVSDNPNLLTLINLNLSHKEVSIKINRSQCSVREWRIRNIPFDIYKKYFNIKKRYSEKEIYEIRKGIIPEGRKKKNVRIKMKKENIDYSENFYSHSKINLKNIKKVKSNTRYKYSEIKDILSKELNLKEYCLIYGRSLNSVKRVRSYYGKLVCN